jgi:syntaxin 5
MGDGSAPRADAKGKGRARPNGDVLAMDIVSAEEGRQNGPYAQMQLVEQQVSNTPAALDACR